MDLTSTTYLIVGFTFALYIGIAIWARAGSTKEFYVAGGGVHPIVIGGHSSRRCRLLLYRYGRPHRLRLRCLSS